jgi:hypothetical protein
MKEWLLLSEGHKPYPNMTKKDMEDLFAQWAAVDAKRKALEDDQ